MTAVPDSMIELVADFDATQAYVRDQVTEKADSSSFEELVVMEEAVRGVKAACDEALALIRTEQLRQLEVAGSRQVGGKVYARVPDEKVRFDHSKIAQEVRRIAREQAVKTDTGVIDTDLLADLVTKMMRDLYTAPATKAKTTVLDKLGIGYKDVAKTERTGHKIRVIDLEGTDE